MSGGFDIRLSIRGEGTPKKPRPPLSAEARRILQALGPAAALLALSYSTLGNAVVRAALEADRLKAEQARERQLAGGRP